jgi:hypothetical protein
MAGCTAQDQIHQFNFLTHFYENYFCRPTDYVRALCISHSILPLIK